jgi:glycerophosphoryl diester phosphodiesterase
MIMRLRSSLLSAKAGYQAASIAAALAAASCALDAPPDDDAVVADESVLAADPALAASPQFHRDPTLVARAVLPAETYAPGPVSGSRVASPTNGVSAPFPGQPVQGFSAVVPAGDGTYYAMPDNGFGTLESSADFRLRVYRIAPAWETAQGGTGTVDVQGWIELADPYHQIPFAIANHFVPGRPLTGADLDIESFRVAADGTLWFGDEFGPFLIHTDARGQVLEAPIAVPDLDADPSGATALWSPQNPAQEEASAVRVMNALASHGSWLGGTRRPVFSPWEVLIADGDPSTGQPDRAAPPAGSGLAAASSEIFDVASLHAAGYDVVTWTVNDPARMAQLLRLGVDGIISDRPDLLYAAVAAHDADGDGTAGDLLDAEGLVDPAKFDAQGHRGGRNLRPENTLPAMEVALDNLMTTLELDVGLSRDLVPVLDHDPRVAAEKCRRADGAAYGPDDEVRVKDHTWSELRSTFVCDKLFRGPTQRNNPALSPATVAYRLSHLDTLPHVYAMPSLGQVFEFVDFYVEFYRTGVGRLHPQAARRARNAERVRFNIETKLNPRQASIDDTHGPALFALVVSGHVVARDLADRADIQSFDLRSLLWAHLWAPAIRTVALFGDFPVYADPTIAGSDDGTNLQPEGDRTPWLGGLPWPYRQTRLDHPVKVARSGGFEGMAIAPDGMTLYPLLEQPLAGDPTGQLRMFAYDLATRTWTDRARYQLEAPAIAIGDFLLTDDEHGMVIERDNTQGSLTAVKKVYEIGLRGDAQPVAKRPLIDLLTIADPAAISAPAADGDVGLGTRFGFPFQTIESIVALDGGRVLIANDNNFPFSVGRHLGTSRPDDNELIVLQLDRHGH